MAISADVYAWLEFNFPTQKSINDYILDVQSAYAKMVNKSERDSSYRLFIDHLNPWARKLQRRHF
jgi:hypothetical protein